jgi:3-methyladenine DNA glycosylase/8-oxoguanine DNA glycosylase
LAVSSSASVVFDGPASPAMTLSPQRRGPGDPCLQLVDGAIWKTSLMPSGPVTARIERSDLHTVDCEAWGEGAGEFLERLPALLGVHDDVTGFAPQEPTIAAAHRRVPHLRLGRTDRVLEALVPAVLEQRVAGKDAFRAWRLLVTKYGSPAPGPAPARMRVPPPAEVWRRVPSWEFHLANVDPAGPARWSVALSGPMPWSGCPPVRRRTPARR